MGIIPHAGSTPVSGTIEVKALWRVMLRGFFLSGLVELPRKEPAAPYPRLRAQHVERYSSGYPKTHQMSKAPKRNGLRSLGLHLVEIGVRVKEKTRQH